MKFIKKKNYKEDITCEIIIKYFPFDKMKSTLKKKIPSYQR